MLYLFAHEFLLSIRCVSAISCLLEEELIQIPSVILLHLITSELKEYLPTIRIKRRIPENIMHLN